MKVNFSESPVTGLSKEGSAVRIYAHVYVYMCVSEQILSS